MISEFLVLLACTQNKGCHQATDQYFRQHKEIIQFMKHHETKLKETVGPELVALAPFTLALVKKQGIFHLNKYFNLQLSYKNDNLLIFKFDF